MLANLKGLYPLHVTSNREYQRVYIYTIETPHPERRTSGDGKGNPSIPGRKSKSVHMAVENVENNTRLCQTTDGIHYVISRVLCL